MRRIASLAAVVAVAVFGIPPPALAAPDWSWPVRGDVVTPYRNGDDAYAAGQHRGIDIAAAVGTPVDSATAGRVVHAGVAGSSGLTVAVLADGGGLELSYLHLSTAAVREGQVVARGDRIGAVGTSGRRSVEQPHLHFGVHLAGDRHAYRDPLDFLPPLAARAVEPRPPAAAPAPVPVAAPPAAVAAPSAPEVAAPGPAVEPVVEPPALPAPLSAAPVPAGAPASPQPTHRLNAPRAAPSPSGHGVRVPERHAQSPARADAPRDQHPSAAADRGAQLGRAPHDTAASAHTPPAPRAAAHASSAGAVDAGRLAAAAGLIAAAACLGRPRSTRRALRGGRAALAGLLRPLGERG